MNDAMHVAIAILLWLALSAVSCGAFLADTQWDLTLDPEFNREHFRRDLSASALFSLAGPISLLAAFFSTGFFEHGFQWTRKPGRGL